MKLTTYKNYPCEEGDPCIGHCVSWTVHVNDPVPKDYKKTTGQLWRANLPRASASLRFWGSGLLCRWLPFVTQVSLANQSSHTGCPIRGAAGQREPGSWPPCSGSAFRLLRRCVGCAVRAAARSCEERTSELRSRSW